MAIRSSDIEKCFKKIPKLLFETLPYVFWKDKDGRYKGANKNQILNMGFSSSEAFIGKTIYELIDQASAKVIDALDQKVMQEDKTLVFEETLFAPVGKKSFLSQKSPIHDEQGSVIGLLGFAMDITELKQREEEVKKERDRLIKSAAQASHDIRSPVASILMLLKSSKADGLPEKERVVFREAATRIQDIANNLLHEFKLQDSKDKTIKTQMEEVLVSTVVSQLVAEKKAQYVQLPMQLEYAFSSQAFFCFVKAVEADVRRALSNLIDNAVEACDQMVSIKIQVKIDADSDRVKLTVADNGKGMSPDLVDKLLNNIKVTQDKAFGHGLGLLQVRETIYNSNGQFLVESAVGKGTAMTMSFPRHPPASWLADKISINADDLVIVLDDDGSIHGAWDARFETFLRQIPSLKIRHFTDGDEALAVINQLGQERDKIFLLADYELLKQNLTGLDVIATGSVKRAVLVTSYYDDLTVRAKAIEANIKILPKQLAFDVPIDINPVMPKGKHIGIGTIG